MISNHPYLAAAGVGLPLAAYMLNRREEEEPKTAMFGRHHSGQETMAHLKAKHPGIADALGGAIASGRLRVSDSDLQPGVAGAPQLASPAGEATVPTDPASLEQYRTVAERIGLHPDDPRQHALNAAFQNEVRMQMAQDPRFKLLDSKAAAARVFTNLVGDKCTGYLAKLNSQRNPLGEEPICFPENNSLVLLFGDQDRRRRVRHPAATQSARRGLRAKEKTHQYPAFLPIRRGRFAQAASDPDPQFHGGG